jgi:hypothetical protein
MSQENVFGHLLPPAPATSVPAGNPVAPGIIYGKPKTVDPYKVQQDQIGNANEGVRLDIARQNAANSNQDQDRQNRAFPMQRGDSLRQDFDTQQDVKNYKTVIPIFLSGLQAEQNATGDLQLMNAYSKVVDPASVVREGEVQMAGNTDSYLNQLIAKLKKQGELDGGGNLSTQARARLKNEMNTRVASLAKAYGVQRERFQALAQRQEVNPEDVVGGFPVSQAQIDQYLKLVPGADQSRPDPNAPAPAGGGIPKFGDEIPTDGPPRMSPEKEGVYGARQSEPDARHAEPLSRLDWRADLRPL